MRKKYTYEFVKSEFEKEGYTLLSKEYKDSKSKLKYRCPKNHQGRISYSSFQQGHRCIECAGLKKHTYEFIKSQFEKEGYQLLSTEYVNNRQKLKVKCDKGHTYLVAYRDFGYGKRCKLCFYERNKFSYEFVKSQFEKEGYTLLSKEYKDSKSKLKYLCPKGHIGSTTFHSFREGTRCSICYRENIFGENSTNWKGGVTKLKIALYDTYAHKLDWCEEVRRDPNNYDYLQVRCKFCDNWFAPTIRNVQARIDVIEGRIGGGCNLYCSTKCRKSCCLYGQQKYPKGINKYENYRAEVKYISNVNFRKFYWQINPENLKRGYNFYHLDHIYPVIEGFNNGIPPEVLANPNNLQMLWCSDNSEKSDKLNITKKELYDGYNKFNEVN